MRWTITPERIATLKPESAAKRRKFEKSYLASFSADASKTGYKYRPGSKDTASPNKTARAIKQAVEDDTPSLLLHPIKDSVYMMALCAGNPISMSAPLEAQYLAAFQRIDDLHRERLLYAPEELMRFSALVAAAHVVEKAVADYYLWKKGGE